MQRIYNCNHSALLGATGDSVLPTCLEELAEIRLEREVGQVREDLAPGTVATVCQALCDGYKDEQNQVCYWQEPKTECGVIEGGPWCDRSTAWTGKAGKTSWRK